MKKAQFIWLALSIAASFVAVGVSYWPIPYAKLNLPDALLGPGLGVVVISALLLRALRVAPFWRIAWMLGGTVVLVVLARIVVEVVRDSTSHNLWPFEVVIASVIGFACSAAGTMMGSLVASLVPGRLDDES